MSDCPKCGEPLDQHEHLTDEEFAEVTEAFVERLSSAMGSAGCNDVFPEEFGESVAQKFRFDQQVLEAWEEKLAELWPMEESLHGAGPDCGTACIHCQRCGLGPQRVLYYHYPTSAANDLIQDGARGLCGRCAGIV